MAEPGCQVQGGVAVVARRVHVGALAEQELNAVVLAEHCGAHERGLAVRVRRLELRPRAH